MTTIFYSTTEISSEEKARIEADKLTRIVIYPPVVALLIAKGIITAKEYDEQCQPGRT